MSWERNHIQIFKIFSTKKKGKKNISQIPPGIVRIRSLPIWDPGSGIPSDDEVEIAQLDVTVSIVKSHFHMQTRAES